MRITTSGVKLAVSSTVLIALTAMIIVVFGQIRFDQSVGYTAAFSNASGIRAGQFVRASGVEVGKVSGIRMGPDDSSVLVEFRVDRSLPLYASTTASIRYANLIGDRYLELKRGTSNAPLSAGAQIPIARTEPALDLDALIGGFRPLFRSLDPQRVNNIASSLVTILQGEGGTINDILDQTSSLTSALADRDTAIGDVIKNLNTVLETVVRHQRQFDSTLNNVEVLITSLKNRATPLANSVASIGDSAGSLADLLADNRPQLRSTVEKLEVIQQPIVDQRADFDDLLTKLPAALQTLSRSGGIYGDFFNFYLCDATLKLNGLQPGGPVRTVRLLSQPTGRCTPK